MLNRSILTALLTLAALALPASAAIAAGSSGAVVFSRVTQDSREIELPDGKKEVRPAEGGLFAARSGRLNQLTEDPGDSEPSFSPDGRTIVFARSGDIYSTRPDGTGRRRLTSGTELDSHPTFHPRGRYLLFERRAAEGGPGDLYIVSLGGGRANPLTTTPEDEHEASFASDGRTIVFVRSTPLPEGGSADALYSIRPSGAGLKRLPARGQDAFRPRYFSGGIVFNRGQSGEGLSAFADVYTMRSNGTKVKPLVRGVGSAYVEDVSPDGRTVLFRRDLGLWVKPIGRGRARKIAEVADNAKTNSVFSSDGREVATFAETETGSETRATLTAISVRTGKERELAQGFAYTRGTQTTTIGPVIAWQPVRVARK
jgi:dipeptidyl aminopeptidase/acylaminoacyl peptidase